MSRTDLAARDADYAAMLADGMSKEEADALILELWPAPAPKAPLATPKTNNTLLASRKPTNTQLIFDCIAERGTADIQQLCDALQLGEMPVRSAILQLRRQGLLSSTTVVKAPRTVYALTPNAKRPVDGRIGPRT